MHSLLALAVQRVAYKRVGELPADARSAEAGIELAEPRGGPRSCAASPRGARGAPEEPQPTHMGHDKKKAKARNTGRREGT